MRDWALARKIYRDFASKPHAQHISTEFALRRLAQFLSRRRPQSVLEVGAGIGAITTMLLTHPARPQKIVSTEDLPLCLGELDRNLAGLDLSGWRVVGDMSEIGADEVFDLVIFDGTLSDERQHDLLREGAWCFVEGGRRKTREALSAGLAQSGLALEFESHLPARPVRVKWRKRVLGVPVPSIKRQAVKGCFLGQAVRIRS